MTPFRRFAPLALLFPLLAGSAGGVAAQAQTQCVSNALAGGTVDHITIPLQPCALSTNLLILTAAGANTIAQPTLQMAGGPQLNIYTSTGTAPGIGAIPGAGATILLTSTGTAWKIVSGNASTTFSGVLTVPNGGTGDSTLTANGLLVGQGTGAVSTVTVGTTGTFLGGNTGSPPSFKSIAANLVSSWSAGSTGLTPSSATTGAVTLAGTLGTANGGTGLTGFTTGDLFYASSSSVISKLAAAASGNVLLSGTSPSWGKVDLTAAVSGLLPVANGGSGAGSLTAHGVLLGQGTSAFSATAVGGTGQYFKGVSGSDPVWGTLASDTVSSITFGTTGLTPSSPTAGAVTVAGTLGFANGGTSNSSYTNGQLLIGNSGTGGLSKAALTAGSNVTITNSAGGITIASTGLASGCSSGAAVLGAVMVADGSSGCTTGNSSITGTLVVSGLSTLTGGVNLAGASAPLQFASSAGTSGYLATSAGAGATPTWTNPTSLAVTSLSFGTTGLTPATATQGAVTVAGTLGVANGGTGQSSYTDGQLLIGNTATGLLSKAALTAGTNISITNGNGSISISATGGSAAVVAKTASFNAASGASYCVDSVTAAGTVTATMPASPSNGDIIYFTPCSNYSVFNLVVARNGNNIQGLGQDMTVRTNNAAFNLTFVTSYGWRLN